MNLIVCLKQIPSEESIKFDSNGNLIRENIKLINNIYDEYALENALILKDKYGFKVTAITMGPTSAEEIIRYAISKGVDEGYLITDPKLKGSDAFITSMVISKAIEKIKKEEDYAVFFGLKSGDGETGVVASEVSRFLKIPVVCGVSEIDFFENCFFATQLLSFETVKLKIQKPCCLSFDLSKIKFRVVSIKNKIKSKNFIVPKFSLSDLNLEIDGIKDSPTKVLDLKEVQTNSQRNFEELKLENPEDIEKIKKIIYE
ncbi:MAG: hypothetical protein N2Z60_06045 [Elusimicrobiales bacterium]|nr:hypothetical protein [Elusimicrobiales bacterium]HOJ86516.1 hypothetical protein [Elusimicrobiales bacterium]HOL62998.1 hypothetical protein [Elusimicrobiales bacterium]HPO95074.1 hypothetical protein [Elusimicrobiales bacterium]